MRALVASILFMLSGSISAGYAQDSQPSETTETFGAWTVRCRAAGEARSCELIHAIQAQSGVMAQLAFGTPPGADKPLAVVQVPLGVLVARPVTIAVQPEGAALEIPFSTCLQIGCLAQRSVEPAELDGMAAGASAELSFSERTGRLVRVAVRLEGFKAALARLRAL